MSASALVVIDDMFHKILNTLLDRKSTLGIPICLYLCTFISSITSAFSLKILGQKERGESLGWWRLSIWFSTSSSLTKVSWQKGPMCHHKYLNVQALQPFHQISWYKRGRGSWDDPRTSQKSPRTTLYSVC